MRLEDGRLNSVVTTVLTYQSAGVDPGSVKAAMATAPLDAA